MGFYINGTKNGSKKSLSTVYSNLRAQYPGKEVYLCNGGLYGMTSGRSDYWEPCLGLKANGVVYGTDWCMNGIGIKDNKMYHLPCGVNPSSYTDAISGFPPLIENGKKSSQFSYCLDNSNRGRTMLGFNNTSVIVSVVADVSGSSDFTMDEEISHMMNLKCDYAINLDGGGSSQCNFNGSTIYSSRVVHNMFYIIANPTTTSKQENSGESTNVDTSKLKIGDSFKLVSGAKYTSGGNIPSFIINSTVYVRAFSGNNIIFSTQQTGEITGIVSPSYISGYTGTASSSSSTTTTTKPTTTITPTTQPTTLTTTTKKLAVGDKMGLVSGAKYITGVSIPNWVINSQLYIRGINGDNITFSTLKTGATTGIVNKKYIK